MQEIGKAVEGQVQAQFGGDRVTLVAHVLAAKLRHQHPRTSTWTTRAADESLLLWRGGGRVLKLLEVVALQNCA